MTPPISIPPTPALVPGQDAPALDTTASTGEPAADFARLLTVPASPAGDTTAATAAEPAPTPGAVTRLKLTAGGPPGAVPLTREQAEAAAALLAPLWQMFSNLPTAPILSPSPAAGGADDPSAEGTVSAPESVSTPGAASRITLFLDERPVLGGETSAALSGQDPAALTKQLATALAEPATTEPPAAAAGDHMNIAFELPDGHTVRAELAAVAAVALPRPALREPIPVPLAGVAKNAASPALPENSATTAILPANKNFLNVEGKDDEMQMTEVGIGVAQPRPAMAAPTTERPTAVDLIVQSFVPENRTDAVAPMADIREHRPATIAHRAIEAVAAVVETQAAARLQPAPGVQLRLKLGGEDIAIRVELRDGYVHTQFRTDSSEVRQAIAHEWSLLRAESPERTIRYLEPVFPADRQGFSPSGSGQHGAASHQQPRPAQPEIFGGIGRSYPYSRTEADSPVLEIAAQMLPTSVHLSAVA